VKLTKQRIKEIIKEELSVMTKELAESGGIPGAARAGWESADPEAVRSELEEELIKLQQVARGVSTRALQQEIINIVDAIRRLLRMLPDKQGR